MEDGIGQGGLAAGEHALRLQSEAAAVPSSSYRFWGANFLRFSAKKLLVRPSPLLADLLLGLIPAGEEFLRRLLVAPLQVAHARNVFGVLVPVSK